MRILEDSSNPDEIKSNGNTPLGSDFPEGHIAEVVDVVESPSASGTAYTYKFETQEGVTFNLSHEDLEQAIEQELISLY